MSEQECQHLKKQAEIAGLGVDPFIRNLVKGVQLHPRSPKTYAALMRELSASGNIMNQLVYIGQTPEKVHPQRKYKKPLC